MCVLGLPTPIALVPLISCLPVLVLETPGSFIHLAFPTTQPHLPILPGSPISGEHRCQNYRASRNTRGTQDFFFLNM